MLGKILAVFFVSACVVFAAHIQSDGKGGYWTPDGKHVQSDGMDGFWTP